MTTVIINDSELCLMNVPWNKVVVLFFQTLPSLMSFSKTTLVVVVVFCIWTIPFSWCLNYGWTIWIVFRPIQSLIIVWSSRLIVSIRPSCFMLFDSSIFYITPYFILIDWKSILITRNRTVTHLAVRQKPPTARSCLNRRFVYVWVRTQTPRSGLLV